MSDKTQNPGTPCQSPGQALHDQIQAEFILLLEELRQRFGVDGIALAWAAHNALSRNIQAHEGEGALIEFQAKLMRETKITLDAIENILREDARDHNRMH